MRTPTRTVAALALLAAAVSAGCGASATADGPLPGPWRAVLESPGGELPFGLELARGADGWSAVIVNGDERIDVPRVEVDGATLLLAIDDYDSRIEARVADAGTRLDGEWTRTGSLGTTTRLPFAATAGEAPRFPADEPPATSLDGRWRVRFESEVAPAVGSFEQGVDGTVRGTFLTLSGDYRYLAGRLDGERLRMSCFDGAHAFLFDARLAEDGSLAGDFWSRDTWHETWVAVRDDDVTLPDAYAVTGWREDVGLADMTFRDLDGVERGLDDPAFAGRATLLYVFGSWCPNCGDATPVIADLYRRYRDDGLSVVGLAFELSGDVERDLRQLQIYVDERDVPFPVLLAGTSDKDAASRALPLLDRVRAYPTTVFVRGDGAVTAVHTGFNGPATGELHDELRRGFERRVRTLLGFDAGREA